MKKQQQEVWILLILLKNIYKIADFDTMCMAYMGFYTLSPEMAVDRLIEAYESHK